MPRDIMRVKWAPGETTNTGGDDYLLPFGAKQPPPAELQSKTAKASNKKK